MAAPLLPVIVQENWAQCENPNCNKWRRLPPHFEVGKDRGRLVAHAGLARHLAACPALLLPLHGDCGRVQRSQHCR